MFILYLAVSNTKSWIQLPRGAWSIFAGVIFAILDDTLRIFSGHGSMYRFEKQWRCGDGISRQLPPKASRLVPSG